MDEEKKFEIRSYGKGELASLYLPGIGSYSAIRALRKWIVNYPGLADALVAMGYQKESRRFTPGQVGLIVQALGPP